MVIAKPLGNMKVAARRRTGVALAARTIPSARRRSRSASIAGLSVAGIIVLAVAALTGCGRAVDPVSAQPAAAPAAIELRTADEKELARVVESHRGNVVLIDYWATWCGPCRELFPHTVALRQSLAERGLTVISVSLDDPDDHEAVLQFLREKGAAFENFISPYGSSPRTFEAFEITAPPQVDLYDRQGNLYRRFASDGGALKPEEVAATVQALLDAASGPAASAAPAADATPPQP